MGRLSAFASFFALLVLCVWSPAPATAAVAVHSYQITSGSSFGTLDIGTITGGTYSVRFPATPCAGPAPATCPATLLSASFVGTAGQVTVPSVFHGPGGAPPQFRGDHSGTDISAIWTVRTYVGQGGRGRTLDFRQGPPFTATVDTTFRGSYRTRSFSTAGGMQVNAGLIVFGGHEVLVPEPSSSALLVTGALMLGAYALRRARRSLV